MTGVGLLVEAGFLLDGLQIRRLTSCPNQVDLLRLGH